MFAGTGSIPNGAEQLLLRWSETPNSQSREELVQIIEADLSEAVLRSALEVSEKTRVYLIGKQYTGNGIVRSCRCEGSSFILTIVIGNENIPRPPRSEIDPGVLAVEEFLTEEQERKILEEFEAEERSRALLLDTRTDCA